MLVDITGCTFIVAQGDLLWLEWSLSLCVCVPLVQARDPLHQGRGSDQDDDSLLQLCRVSDSLHGHHVRPVRANRRGTHSSPGHCRPVPARLPQEHRSLLLHQGHLPPA